MLAFIQLFSGNNGWYDEKSYFCKFQYQGDLILVNTFYKRIILIVVNAETQTEIN